MNSLTYILITATGLLAVTGMIKYRRLHKNPGDKSRIQITATEEDNSPTERQGDRPAISPDLSDKMKNKVDRWIESKGFCKPGINIKDVAKEIGTNHSYLSAYLNNHLGMTFQVWLNTLRIEESKALLTDVNRKSIEEIGSMVGFTQNYNFSRWFRIVTGTTPFRFRKEGL